MAGIEYRDTDAFIDEIPQAYKPIDVVMRDAEDLVEIRHTLRQIVTRGGIAPGDHRRATGRSARVPAGRRWKGQAPVCRVNGIPGCLPAAVSRP
jgi:hypothetical protein